jgi:hypothetical protein
MVSPISANRQYATQEKPVHDHFTIYCKIVRLVFVGYTIYLAICDLQETLYTNPGTNDHTVECLNGFLLLLHDSTILINELLLGKFASHNFSTSPA